MFALSQIRMQRSRLHSMASVINGYTTHGRLCTKECFSTATPNFHKRVLNICPGSNRWIFTHVFDIRINIQQQQHRCHQRRRTDDKYTTLFTWILPSQQITCDYCEKVQKQVLLAFLIVTYTD